MQAYAELMRYTERRNLNRGYLKLEAWQRGMDLFDLVFKTTAEVPDFKLRSQCATLHNPFRPTSLKVIADVPYRSIFNSCTLQKDRLVSALLEHLAWLGPGRLHQFRLRALIHFNLKQKTSCLG